MNDKDKYEHYSQWKKWDLKEFGVFSKDQSLYYDAEIYTAGFNIKDNLKVLELGFGSGSFAGYAVSKKFEYVGIETQTELVRAAISKGYEAYNISADGDFPTLGNDRLFDLVVAFDVLEHLRFEQILDFLGYAASHLQCSGKVIARFPSGDSPFSGAIQYGDLTHQSYIGSGIITQLVNDSPLEIVHLRSPRLPMLGLGIRRTIRRGSILAFSKIIELLIRILFHNGRKTVLSSNMVCELRLRQKPL